MSLLRTVAEYLEASGTGLYTLTAGRVSMDRLPHGYANTLAALLIRSQAETRHITAPVDTDRIQIRCYGGNDNPRTAWAVFEALRARLHGVTAKSATTGGLVTAELETASPSVEPDTGWPVVIAIFRVRAA